MHKSMTTLIINYYVDKIAERQREIEACLQNNIENPLVGLIVAIHEKGVKPPVNEKILPVEWGQRPTYSECFRIGNYFEGIKVLCNSDIYYDGTVALFEKLEEKQVYALCRWNDTEEGLNFYNHEDSQDAWAWKGQVEVDAPFRMGVPGCDNLIASLLNNAGYQVLSPSKSIRAIHLHRTGLRNYDEKTDRVRGKYMFLNYYAFTENKKKMEANLSETGTDVVYVLGTGSKWNNNELRFSLRSVEKNLKGVRNIVVVGADPGFLTDKVVFIKHPDEIGPRNADGNIIRKVLRACREEWLTDDFLFINDNHLVMKPIDALAVPPFHKGDMKNYSEVYFKVNAWRRRLRRTREILVEKGLPCFNFDCHTPIVLNKKKFVEAMARFDYHNDIGYTMKSLYGNINYLNAPRLQFEKKVVFQKMSIDQIVKHLKNVDFMSFNDEGMNGSLKLWLFRNFPAQSEYEDSGIEDRVIESAQWFHNGKNYEEGVSVFKKYYPGINIANLNGNSNRTMIMKKLESMILRLNRT